MKKFKKGLSFCLFSRFLEIYSENSLGVRTVVAEKKLLNDYDNILKIKKYIDDFKESIESISPYQNNIIKKIFHTKCDNILDKFQI